MHDNKLLNAKYFYIIIIPAKNLYRIILINNHQLIWRFFFFFFCKITLNLLRTKN